MLFKYIPSDMKKASPTSLSKLHSLTHIILEDLVQLVWKVFHLLCCSMGAVISRVKKRFFPICEVRILMVGLDASGKTTILFKLKLGQIVMTVPTIGFNVETVEYKNMSCTVWDVGGQDKIRPLWRHYFQNTQGLVFVVDSNDRGRISEARNELHRILSEPELCSAAVLVFANKQDLPHTMGVSEIANKLALHTLSQRQWYIQGASATSGQGLFDGLDWLCNIISNKSNQSMMNKVIS